MLKSTHTSFPQEGIDLHVSAQDALATGINPGDPAVVEVIVRAHTVQEWIAHASGDEFHTEDEAPAPAAQPAGGAAAEDHPRIRWTSGRAAG